MANTTWNPSDKSSGITLSNGNLTAVTSFTNQSVRAIDRQNTGKFYFEVTCTTISINLGVGVMAGGGPITAGTIVGAIVIVSGGALIYLNGVSTGINIGTIASGSLLGIAIDFTNQLAWFRVGAAGNWNGNAGFAPDTGVGGVSFAVLGGAAFPFYPYAAINNSGSSITVNFGDTAFTGTVPSGFTSGFTAGATIANNVVVTQAAIEEWHSPSPTAQVTQVAAEHWFTTNPNAQVTQVALEHWTSVQATFTGPANPTIVLSASRAGIGSVVFRP